VLDFNGAYERRHGRPPNPLLRRHLEAQIETIAACAGCEPKNVVAEMDIESGKRHQMLRTVRKGESIVARGGRGTFSLTFLRVEGGRLVSVAFNNGRYEGEVSFAEGESAKVWCGTLMDGRLFTVTLRRLPSCHGCSETLGCIELQGKTAPPAYSRL